MEPLPSWTCPENLQKEAHRGHPDVLNVFSGSFYCKGPAAPYPVSKAEPSHPRKDTALILANLQSCSFSHKPKFITIGEGLNPDRLVNEKLCLPAQLALLHNCPSQHLKMTTQQSTRPSITPSYHHSWTRSWDNREGPHTPQRLKPTANCLYPTTLLPLVWSIWQKSCIEHTASTCCQLQSSVHVLTSSGWANVFLPLHLSGWN